MDNQRLLVWAAFGLMLWFTYQAWVADYGPEPAAPAEPVTEGTAERPAETTDLPALPDPAAVAPATDPTIDPTIDNKPELPGESTDRQADGAAGIIRVTTDVLDVEISSRGGTLQRATLLDYPVAKDQPNVLVQLLSPEASNFGLLQTGLRTAEDGPEPNHLAQFKSESTEYVLGERDELTVSLTWENGQGVSVVKQYRFSRGSYAIDVQQSVVNDGESEWRGAAYAQIQRHSSPQERSMFDVDSYSFHGPVIYDGERSTKLDRDDLLSDGPFNLSATNAWIASIEHHFLSAVVPPGGTEHRYSIAVRDDVAVSSVIGPAVI
ncbi:MAG: membrane protein insertase YidC, partial [Woeseiaceae bacterium]